MGLHSRCCFACGGYHPSARPLRTRASEIHDFRSIAVPARCVTLPVAAHSRPNHPAFTSFPRTRQSTGFTGHDPEGRRPTSPSCWRSCTRRFRVDLGASAMVAQHWEVGALSAPVHVKSDAAASRGAIRSSRSTADGYYMTGICSSCSRRSSRHRRQAAAAAAAAAAVTFTASGCPQGSADRLNASAVALAVAWRVSVVPGHGSAPR